VRLLADLEGLPGRAVVRWMVVAVSVAAGCLTGAGATVPVVAADCSRLSPWPSFRDTADSADTVFIGTVSKTALQDPGAYSPMFTLVIDDVLRGELAERTLSFRRFHTGAPQPYCPEDSVLRVQTGDRLAFAPGAELDGERITAVAFITPSEPERGLMPGIELLTEDEVRAIIGVPPASPRTSASPIETAAPGGSTQPIGMAQVVDPPLPVDCRTEFPDLTGGREVTAEELMRLCRDAYLDSGVDRVTAYAKTQPDFAGIVVRRGTDPGWTIWFTTDLPRHEAELAPLTPEGTTVVLLAAELTLRELEGIQELVSADLPSLLAMGMRIEEVGVDPERNAVVVGLREDSPGALLILQQRYGPHVITEGVGAT
jgi:hypothetical protein